ncbi:phosphatase PAP2 family protein [Paenibacillus sp. YYML68]|uniref:phosphatase PAP2 family protein n=1 Tax=Paenibacillus sp. YYML68 TaxID=2909250 RepID=UPI002491BDCE|nr:phosphatase PAP2 family protein [Paenibacillus sp. YYML68]
MNKPFPLRLAILFTAVWAGLAAVFAVIDLPLAIAVYNPASEWGLFLQTYGEHPTVFLVWLAAQVPLSLSRFLTPPLRLASRLLLYTVSLAAGYALVLMTVQRAMHAHLSIIGVILVLLAVLTLTLLVQAALTRVQPDRLKQLHRAAWLTLLLFGAELALVHLLKLGWGRIRFRDLLPDHSNFTSWYVPMGPTGGRSFPSAHSSNSWALLTLPAMVAALHASLSFRWAAWIFAIGWASLTSLSRVVIGAHFASDVLFGACITITLLVLLQRCLPLHRDLTPTSKQRSSDGPQSAHTAVYATRLETTGGNPSAPLAFRP